MELSRSRGLLAFEWTCAALLTTVVLCLHVRTLTHAGPLWRDEVSSLRLATMPSWHDAWATLVFDPAPAGFFALLRAWCAAGFGTTDFHLRFLGLLIGCAGVAALWICSLELQRRPPIWPLVLFAMNPVTIQFGDSMRGYGLAVFFVLLFFAAIWRVTFGGKIIATIVAAISAIGCVQSIFTNAILVFALCGASICVLTRRKLWKRAALVCAIGIVAAASILPYLPIFARTKEWSIMVSNPISFVALIRMYGSAMGQAHPVAAWATVIAILLTLSAGLLALVKPAQIRLEQTDADQLGFVFVALIIGTFGTVTFFHSVRWPTSIWYYMPLLAVTVCCFHRAIAAIPLPGKRTRLFVNALPTALAVALLPATFANAQTRLTNADLMANAIARYATKDDLVVVNPCPYAISFQRYYHGSAPWTTIPALSDYSLHRWDLFKTSIATTNPESAVLHRVAETLRSGHRVFLIGDFPQSDGIAPQPLLPAPNSEYGWSLGSYRKRWSLEMSYLIKMHTIRGALLLAGETYQLSDLENLRTMIVEGWRE